MGFTEFERSFDLSPGLKSPTETSDSKNWSNTEVSIQFKIESGKRIPCVIELNGVKMAMEVEHNQNQQLGFPFWKPLRRRFGPDSPFFAPGNLERELLAKQVSFSFCFSNCFWCLINGCN